MQKTGRGRERFFTEKINVDFTSMAGGKPAQMTAEEHVSGWQKNLYAEKKSYHLRGNQRITVSGNRAGAFSKAYEPSTRLKKARSAASGKSGAITKTLWERRLAVGK